MTVQETRNDEPQFLLELEGEEARARWRESGMASVIAHLVMVLLILLQPKLFPVGPLVTPEMEQLARMQRVFVYLPPEAPKVEKLPERPTDTSRITIKPTLKIRPETLRELSAPPPGEQKPSATAQLPLPPTPQKSEPGKSGQVARLEAPAERSESPGRLPLPLSSAGRAIEESIRGTAPGSPGPVGSGEGLPGRLSEARRSNFSTSQPLILSDTRGVDFGPYLARVLASVRRNWYAVIPESARLGQKGKVIIVFTILKDGSVPMSHPVVTRSSGQDALDRAAFSAIVASAPFPPLPAQFTGEHIVLQFTFLYNLPLEY